MGSVRHWLGYGAKIALSRTPPLNCSTTSYLDLCRAQPKHALRFLNFPPCFCKSKVSILNVLKKYKAFFGSQRLLTFLLMGKAESRQENKSWASYTFRIQDMELYWQYASPSGEYGSCQDLWDEKDFGFHKDLISHNSPYFNSTLSSRFEKGQETCENGSTSFRDFLWLPLDQENVG